MVFRLLKNAFVSQKIESIHFYSWPPKAILSPRFLLSPHPGGGKLLIPRQAAFFKYLFPQQKGGGGNYVDLLESYLLESYLPCPGRKDCILVK